MVIRCKCMLTRNNGLITAQRALRLFRRYYEQEFPGDINYPHEVRVSEAEVNKRLSGQELNYSGRNNIMFSANQVGVNRPVEDRWIAYHFGPQASREIYSTGSILKTDAQFGGTVFTVLDGHGGHACAHAINLLHSDYLIAGLMPLDLCEQALANLRMLEESHAPHFSSELCEVLWTRPEAVVTSKTEHVGFPQPVTQLLTRTVDPTCQWSPWGMWGPLPSSINVIHMNHLRLLMEQLLSAALDESSGTSFTISNDGDICDPEGFIVAPASALHKVGQDPTASSYPPSTNLLVDSPLSLHNRITHTAQSLRDAFKRLDLDVSTAAQPVNRGPALDKALLRIVFSGCVSTTAYISQSAQDLYVAQVGDCGAVLGRYLPAKHSGDISFPPEDPVRTGYSPVDWHAELLAQPHNSENERDVQRLKSSHPLHETSYLLRDGRLLGELMPLRAFGDIRFKWRLDELKYVARLLDLPPNYPIACSFYSTPPYLIATPQIIWRPLISNQDHFLILATDGLWDMISPKEAVQVVARHWFDYNCDPSICGPGDTAASRLIRTALGGDSMDTGRISMHFSMPASVARYYRDDITVIVVYLPSSSPPTE